MTGGIGKPGLMNGENQKRPRFLDRNSLAFVGKMLSGTQVVVDIAVMIFVGFACYYSMVFYSYKTAEFYYAAICFNCLFNVLLFQFAGLYDFEAVNYPRRVLDRVLIAISVTFLMMMAAAFSLKISDIYSRNWFAVFYLSTVAGVISGRFILASAMSFLTLRQISIRRLAVYGVSEQILAFTRHLQSSDRPIAFVTSVFIEQGENEQRLTERQLKVGGNLDDLIAWIRADEVDDVIIALPWSNVRRISQVVETLRELPTNVMLSGDLASYSVPMAPGPGYLEGENVFQVVGKPLSGWDVVIKTLLDYTIATVLLVVLFPFLAILTVLIKLDSSGPVLFKQPRLGFNNRVFDVYKFRSMVHVNIQPLGKTVQATVQDPRVTRFGRFIRRSSIDELPQLLNVLNGTMSLVGPRPHALDHNEDYARKIRGYFARHKTKPGITGLAQVKGYRGPTDTDDKMEKRVQYDIQYIENWSLLLDIKILLMTVKAVLFPKNAV